MKNLRKLTDTNLQTTEIDRHMSDIINQKFDEELKSTYAEILANKYKVHRTPRRKTNWVLISLVALVSLLCAYFAFKGLSTAVSPEKQDFKQMALNYDNEHPFTAQTITRSSVATAEDHRIKAHTHFENQNYTAVLADLNLIEDRNKEDVFLLAYAQFKLSKYSEAGDNFKKVIAMDSDESYHSEARLYRVLCLFASGKTQEAQETMGALAAGSWELETLKGIYSEAK